MELNPVPTQEQLNIIRLEKPGYVHASAFRAAAQAAERMGFPLAAAALNESADRAEDNGGWLDSVRTK